MQSVIRRLAILTLLTGFITSAVAQPEPMTWGEIPPEHLDTDVYPADPTASAVVLGSYGQVHFLENLTVIYEIHERIKILSEAGYDSATIELHYFPESNTQRVRNLEGQTFIREADGSVKRVELESRDIMEEEDGDYRVVRFTLPALEPGAIIEYRWRLESRRLSYFPNWYFQGSYPTLHSEFRAEIPTWLTFNMYPVGDPEFSVEEMDVRELNLRDFPHRSSSARVNPRTASTYRWVMNNVPPIRDEEFIAAIRNHAYAMRFQLTGYYQTSGIHRQLSQDWNDVARYYLSHRFFGGRIASPPQSLRREALRIVDGAEDLTEAVTRVYEFVRERMDWDGRFSRFSSRPLNHVFDARRGSSGEINLLLAGMLRSIHIEADPILISTRQNGFIISSLPSAAQFNHVIIGVMIDDAYVFMDATDPHRPINMLPPEALNHHGWLLARDNFRWIQIEPPRGTSGAMQLNVDLDEQGNISGTLAGRFGGYLALDLRRRLRSVNEDSRRGTAIVRDQNIETAGITVSGLEGDGAVTFEMDLSMEDYARPMAHLLTFNPILLGRMDESPFRTPVRMYPVDFTYPRVNTYVATITLPDGYEVDELPAPVEISMPDNSIAYQRTVTMMGDRQINVQRSYALRYTLFDPADYASLRDVYERIAAADSDVVVLVRSEDDGGSETPEILETDVQEFDTGEE